MEENNKKPTKNKSIYIQKIFLGIIVFSICVIFWNAPNYSNKLKTWSYIFQYSIPLALIGGYIFYVTKKPKN